MKKIIAIASFVFFAFNANAQKEEKIEYYTDDEVKHEKIILQGFYGAYFVNRNIISPESFPSDPVNIVLNQSAKGGFGQAVGLDVFYKLNKGLNIGLGFNKSMGSYSIDFRDVLNQLPPEFQTDTIETYVSTTEFSFYNVPLQFMYSASVSDQWDLEVAPQVEMNFVDRIYRDIYPEPTDPDDRFGDQTDKARDINWTIGFSLGANYHISKNFTVFARPQVRYTLRPILNDDDLNEVLLWLGGQAGLRLYL